MAQYPGAIPTLREVENDDGVIYDANAKKVVFAEDINNAIAEIMAIAAELGINPKNAFANVSARIQNAYNWAVQADGKATTASAVANAASRVYLAATLTRRDSVSTPANYVKTVIRSTPTVALPAGKYKCEMYCEYLTNGGNEMGELGMGLRVRQGSTTKKEKNNITTGPIPGQYQVCTFIVDLTAGTYLFDTYVQSGTARTVNVYESNVVVTRVSD